MTLAFILRQKTSKSVDGAPRSSLIRSIALNPPSPLPLRSHIEKLQPTSCSDSCIPPNQDTSVKLVAERYRTDTHSMFKRLTAPQTREKNVFGISKGKICQNLAKNPEIWAPDTENPPLLNRDFFDKGGGFRLRSPVMAVS